MRRQLYRCRYVTGFNWDRKHQGWWRLSWPNGRPAHEPVLS